MTDLTNRITTISYCGIGIITEQTPQGFRIGVINSFNQTAALKANLHTNDVLLRIDSAGGLRTPKNDDEVYQLMRGPQGSRVTIEVLRNGAPTPEILNLTRDIVMPRPRNSWEGANPYIVLDADHRCLMQLSASPTPLPVAQHTAAAPTRG